MPEAATRMTPVKDLLEEAAFIYCAKKRGKEREKVEKLVAQSNLNKLNNFEELKVYSGKTPHLVKEIVEHVAKLIKEDPSSAELVDLGEATGITLAAGGVSKTQIMGFLDSVKSLKVGKLDNLNIARLRPQLAYAVSRKNQIEPLLAVLEPWFQKMKALNEEDLNSSFSDFSNFIETIVAFHCYYQEERG